MHHFHPPEQPATANVAHMRVPDEGLFEQMMKPRASLPCAIKQRVALDDPLDR